MVTESPYLLEIKKKKKKKLKNFDRRSEVHDQHVPKRSTSLIRSVNNSV